MDIITQGYFTYASRVKVTGSSTAASTVLNIPAGVTQITFTGQGGAGVYSSWTGWLRSGNQRLTNGQPFVLGTDYAVDQVSGQWPSFAVYDQGSGYSQYIGAVEFGLWTASQLTISGAQITGTMSQTNSYWGMAYSITNPGPGTYTLYSNQVQGVTYPRSISASASPGVQLRYIQVYTTINEYLVGSSTAASSPQSTNGSKTWASHAAAGNPAAYQQTMTLSGAAAMISCNIASGTTLFYEYML